MHSITGSERVTCNFGKARLRKVYAVRANEEASRLGCEQAFAFSHGKKRLHTGFREGMF